VTHRWTCKYAEEYGENISQPLNFNQFISQERFQKYQICTKLINVKTPTHNSAACIKHAPKGEGQIRGGGG
jgi:hypothetical protein